MLLPKFDILNKIKKERTITLANAIIIAFAAFVGECKINCVRL